MNTVKHYIFTDSHQLVLQQLNKNLAYNEIDSEKKVSLCQLDWCCDLEEQEDLMNNKYLKDLDLILASGK